MTEGTRDPTAPPATAPPEAEPAGGRWARRVLATSLVGTLAVILVRALLVEVLVVSGSSMEPTLVEEDRVVVVKVAEPERGELVVFRNPLDPTQKVIKRVVARAGQRISIRGGMLLVDGREVDEPYLGHASDHDGSIALAETAVPEGHVFVLGDNRVVSSDSRRFGPVDSRLVVGKAVLALWPLRRL